MKKAIVAMIVVAFVFSNGYLVQLKDADYSVHRFKSIIISSVIGGVVSGFYQLERVPVEFFRNSMLGAGAAFMFHSWLRVQSNEMLSDIFSD
jgi:hypothetical protein